MYFIYIRASSVVAITGRSIIRVGDVVSSREIWEDEKEWEICVGSREDDGEDRKAFLYNEDLFLTCTFVDCLYAPGELVHKKKVISYFHYSPTLI